MQRSWKRAASQRRQASSRLQKIVLAVKLDSVCHAEPRVKIQKVDTATQEHVLAIVDQLGVVIARINRK
jgi:hypothetical protein